MAFDRQIAVITITAEASNQPHAARQGVAASFFNRLKAGRFGPTIAAVCTEREQYSSWNGDSVNRANLQRVMRMPPDDAALLDCGIAYDEVAAGTDPTDGATHYHDTSIPPPDWTVGATRTCQLGALIFYKDVA